MFLPPFENQNDAVYCDTYNYTASSLFQHFRLKHWKGYYVLIFIWFTEIMNV